MIDAVFISDLHLNQNEPAILERFERFIEWAVKHVRAVYILGDLFHAYSGDDTLDAWDNAIAKKLSLLYESHVTVYYMHGNRDFLLSQHFANLAKFKIIQEPYILNLNETKVLLAHGDRYCTNDKSHQWLLRITRNRLFTNLFLKLSRSFRKKVVRGVREKSMRSNKSLEDMDVVPASFIKHMKRYAVHVLIHGHTHKPGHITHHSQSGTYEQYVLSDWDDNPMLLCYDKSKRFYFKLL